MRTSHIVLLAGVLTVLIGMAAFVLTAGLLLSGGDAPLRSDRTGVPEGDGVARALALRDFDRVETSGGWRVTLTHGDDWAVEVTVPEGLEGATAVTVEDGRLRAVHRRRPFGGFGRSRRQQPELRVEMPALSELAVAGAAHVSLSGFTGESLDLKGAGALSLNGQAARFDRLNLELAGAARVDLLGVVVTDANLELAGANHVALHLDGGVLSGTVVGAGRVHWTGTISDQRVVLAGAGRVVELDADG